MQRTGLVMAALTALGAAVTGPLADPWVWSLTDFAGGCSPATCTWNFNITAPDYLSIEGFSAECVGNTLENNDNYVLCDQGDSNKAISAKIGQFVTVDGQPKVQTFVSYKYVAPVLPFVAASYNFTAEGEGIYKGRVDPDFRDSFTMNASDVILEKVPVATPLSL